MRVDIEFVLLLGKIPDDVGVRNGDVGVEELQWKIGVLLLVVREVRNLEAVSIGLKD